MNDNVLPILEAKANLGYALKDIFNAMQATLNTLDSADEETIIINSKMRQLDVAAEILKQGGVI